MDLEPNVFVTDKCNQNCIFCSAKDKNRRMSSKEVEHLIRIPFENLSIEGGEPLLDKDLERKIKIAKKAGSKNIILFTNGLLLNEDRTKNLLKAGITTFNFNFPSSKEKMSGFLTGTKNQFKKRVEIIKNTIKLSHKDSVVLTFVLNSYNYKEIVEYIDFINKNFKGFFYISINLVKVIGEVKKNLKLVPKISKIKPYILKAFKFAKKNNIKVISDGFPLCVMKGYEEFSIDLNKILNKDFTHFKEKVKSKICEKCSLNKICIGPRKDYLRIYGERDLRPFKINIKYFLENYYKKVYINK